MSDAENQLFQNLSLAIERLQAVHDDSNTPLDLAQTISPEIDKLVAYKLALRAKAFAMTSVGPEYGAAMKALESINAATETKIATHERSLKLVKDVATTTSAVLDLAVAAGALAA